MADPASGGAAAGGSPGSMFGAANAKGSSAFGKALQNPAAQAHMNQAKQTASATQGAAMNLQGQAMSAKTQMQAAAADPSSLQKGGLMQARQTALNAQAAAQDLQAQGNAAKAQAHEAARDGMNNATAFGKSAFQQAANSPQGQAHIQQAQQTAANAQAAAQDLQNQAVAAKAQAQEAARQQQANIPPSAFAAAQTASAFGQTAMTNPAVRAQMNQAKQTAANAQSAAHDLQNQAVAAKGQAKNALFGAGSTSAVDIARSELEARWAKINEQEAALNKAEGELMQREKQLSMRITAMMPNWPRKFCCISPMVHHDIQGEIVPERRGVVKCGYTMYWITCLMLVANFAFALAMLFTENAVDEDTKKTKSDHKDITQHMAVSALFLTGIIFAFMTWYWPMYKALGLRTTGQYTICLVGLIIAMCFCAFMAIGPVGMGGCGMMYAMEMKDTKGDTPFIPALIFAIVWVIQGIVFFYLFVRVFRFYRVDKKDFQQNRAAMLGSQVKIAALAAAV